MNKKHIAKLLISQGCLQLNPTDPFTYASGLKGPVYCDNRQLLSIPEGRKSIIENFLQIIKEYDLRYDHFAGLATAGIPYAAILADRLNQSMVYIRGKSKSHGKQNLIEGKTNPGEMLLMVEDLINQGSSLDSAIEGALNAELKVDACLCIVDYEMQAAKDIINDRKLAVYSLTDFTSIIEVAEEDQVLTAKEIKLVRDWQRDPTAWS